MRHDNDKYNRVRNLARDRRGASAVVFAGTLLAIMGFVGLATEGSSWYLGRRAIQNAADAAANAGALAAIYGGNPTSAATDVAARNGFPSGGDVTIGVNVTPGGSNSGSKVQVNVQKTISPLIASLFGVNAPTVGAVATAQVQEIGKACVLALTGSVSVAGLSTSFGCAFASNSSAATAISVTGTLQADTVTAVGGCCGTGNLTTRRPASPYHPPTVNPFATVGSDLPAPGGLACQAYPAPAPVGALGYGILLAPYSAGSPKAYCADLTINTAATPASSCTSTLGAAGGSTNCPVYVPAGTYIFKGASLTIAGGTVTPDYCAVKCGPDVNGTSFAFLKDTSTSTTGTLTITGGKVTLLAQLTNALFPSMNGILFYGVGGATATIAQLNASGVQPIGGGIYFPNATILHTGNKQSPSSCIVLVGASVTLYSNSNVIRTSCPNYGTTLASIQGSRLVQ